MYQPQQKFRKSKYRYRVKNPYRAFAAILVLLLVIAGVIFIILKANNPSNGTAPTDQLTEDPATPEPTPTPYPVPEGKAMEPFLVVIDPGHGGRDGGTTSKDNEGLYEKDIVLDISKRVKNILLQRGINVLLTREDDIHLKENSDEDLIARWSFANQHNASLFVSVHVNAYDGKGAAGVNGMEIYYYEDKLEVYDGFTQLRFAEIMKDAVVNASNVNFRFFEGGRQLAVVRNTKMPAVLIETAYITSKEDHERLESDEFREKTAQGIADGIENAMAEIGVFEHEDEMYVFKNIGE